MSNRFRRVALSGVLAVAVAAGAMAGPALAADSLTCRKAGGTPPQDLTVRKAGGGQQEYALHVRKAGGVPDGYIIGVL
jgi:hypothetical protein